MYSSLYLSLPGQRFSIYSLVQTPPKAPYALTLYLPPTPRSKSTKHPGTFPLWLPCCAGEWEGGGSPELSLPSRGRGKVCSHRVGVNSLNPELKIFLSLPTSGIAPGTGTAKCAETQMPASGSLGVCMSTVSIGPLGSVTCTGASSADNRSLGWEGEEVQEPPYGLQIPLADNEGRDYKEGRQDMRPR